MKVRTVSGPPIEAGDERQPMFDLVDRLDDIGIQWDEANFDRETKNVTVALPIDECARLAEWIGERS